MTDIIEALYKAIQAANCYNHSFKRKDYTSYLGQEEWQKLMHSHDYRHMLTQPKPSPISTHSDGEFDGVKIFRVSTRNHLNVVKDTFQTEEQIVYKVLF